MRWILIATALLVAGCASTPHRASLSDFRTAARFVPEPGRSLVYVYRGRTPLLEQCRFSLAQYEATAGFMAWAVFSVEPGSHQLVARCDTQGAQTTIETEPDGVVFVDATFSDDMTLHLVDAQVGTEQVRKRDVMARTIERPTGTQGPGTGSSLEREIRLHCADEWPVDYEMQVWCIKQQNEAMKEVLRRHDSYPEGSEERAIIARCFRDWRSGEATDYQMVAYCSRRQIKAYHALGSP